VLLVAATTTGTAAAAVLYRDAAAESALRSRLVGAPVADTGVRVLAGAAVRSGSDDILQGTVPGLPKTTGRVCLVPGLMDTIKPRRVSDGSTTEVPGGTSGASDQVDVGRAQGPGQSSERVRADR